MDGSKSTAGHRVAAARAGARLWPQPLRFSPPLWPVVVLGAWENEQPDDLEKTLMDSNSLYYGDNLDILRRYVRLRTQYLPRALSAANHDLSLSCLRGMGE